MLLYLNNKLIQACQAINGDWDCERRNKDGELLSCNGDGNYEWQVGEK